MPPTAAPSCSDWASTCCSIPAKKSSCPIPTTASRYTLLRRAIVACHQQSMSTCSRVSTAHGLMKPPPRKQPMPTFHRVNTCSAYVRSDRPTTPLQHSCASPSCRPGIAPPSPMLSTSCSPWLPYSTPSIAPSNDLSIATSSRCDSSSRNKRRRLSSRRSGSSSTSSTKSVRRSR